MNKFQNVLDKMPVGFSSKYFFRVCRQQGMSNVELDGGRAFSFLLDNCNRIDRALWRKREIQSAQLDLTKQAEEMTVEQMIAHLKSLGYKVLKPTYTEA
jgi:hypothetical protein